MASFLGEGATIGSEAGLGPQYIDCTVNGQNLALVDMANRHATVFPLINHSSTQNIQGDAPLGIFRLKRADINIACYFQSC